MNTMENDTKISQTKIGKVIEGTDELFVKDFENSSFTAKSNYRLSQIQVIIKKLKERAKIKT